VAKRSGQQERKMPAEALHLRVVEDFVTIVIRNEAARINEIRDASGHTDPSLTSRGRSAIRGIFGK
jgi:hypothetical protein